MVTRNAGAQLVIAQGGPYAFYLVGGDTHTDTGAAGKNRPVGLFFGNGPCRQIRRIGIVNGIIVNRPDVDALMAELSHYRLYQLFDFITSMVASNHYLHNIISLTLFFTAP